MTETLLELKNVSKSFSLGKKKQNLALYNINLKVEKGEILGIVGESGCGKSTLAKAIMGVFPKTSGEIFYKDHELKLKTQGQRRAFANQVQMIFQDPYMSLDPYMTVASIIGENLEIHKKTEKAEKEKRVHELMELAGLSKELAGRYPHEFSGGQRQRIGIARALAVEPEFIICDEPISALDISIRSQIINLLMELKESLGLTYLFISHDLNIIHHISDRIAVMYAGQIVELGSASEVYNRPLHPYTRMLLRAVLNPVPDQERISRATGIVGETKAIWNRKNGCPFADRCDKADKLCEKTDVNLTEVSAGHFTACHKAGD